MKKRYLVIIVILILLISILLFYYIFQSMKSLKPNAQIIIYNDVIKNFILNSEEKNNDEKTFVAEKKIEVFINKENVEYYTAVLVSTYTVENQLLQYNQSTKKLYKFILRDAKIIYSYNVNDNDISSLYDYSVFPKDVITKYEKIKDSSDLREAINEQVNVFYKKNYNSNYLLLNN